MNITLRIVLTLLTLLVLLGIGLYLRHRLVHRLKKTPLDEWVVQTLGILVIIPFLIIAGTVIPIIWEPQVFNYYVDSFKSQFHITDLTSFAARLLETTLLAVLGIGIARSAQKLTIRGLGENHIDINIRTLIGRIFYFIILSFAAFWILSLWQISVGIPVAAITVITLAITFSVQDILKDLVAGFYILLEHPFHIGDEISTTSVNTYTGQVEDVLLRATKLRLTTGEEVTIPNALIFGNVVVNNTFYSARRATITAALPDEEFVQHETCEQLLGAIKEIERVEPKPEPTVAVSSYTDKQVTLTIRFWIEIKHLSTVSDVMYTLHKVLPHAELTVRESAGDV